MDFTSPSSPGTWLFLSNSTFGLVALTCHSYRPRPAAYIVAAVSKKTKKPPIDPFHIEAHRASHLGIYYVRLIHFDADQVV